MIKHILIGTNILINVPSKKMSWIYQQVSASKTHTTGVMIRNGHGLYEAKASAIFNGAAETGRGFEKTTCDAIPDPVFL